MIFDLKGNIMEILELQEYLRTKEKVCCADLQIDFAVDYTTAQKTVAALLSLDWIEPVITGVYHAVKLENLHVCSFTEAQLQEISQKLCMSHVRILRKLSCFSPTLLSEIRFFDAGGDTHEECMELLISLGLVRACEKGYYSRVGDKDGMILYRMVRMGGRNGSDDED